MKSSHSLDYIVVAAYFLVVSFIGLWAARRKKRTTDDYFLANRRMPGWIVGFAVVGTMISSVSFVAHPGAAFARNWWLIVPNLMVPFLLILVVIFVVPFYRRVVRMSSYEYLEKRFGVLARLYGASGFLLLRTIDLAFTLLLTAIAVEVVTGWDIRLVILCLGLFTILYTLVGGIEAVVYTDVLQGFALATGALSVLLIILFRPEGGPAAVISTAYGGGKFGLGDFSFSWQSLFGEHPTFWILALSGVLHFSRAYMTEPNMVQRYLIARSDRDAQRGVMAGALACLPIWLTFAFIGSCLWAFFQLTQQNLPDEVLQKPDNILPYFINTQLPPGLVGLILAAILSSCNSSVSSDLNSVGTVVTQDYFVRAVPGSSEQTRVLFGRCAVAVTGILCICIAIILLSARAKALVELIVTLGMIFSGGMLGLFALGFLSTRATRRGAYIGTSICLVFILWSTITGPLKINLGFNFNMHPIMIGVFSHFILFITGYFASLIFGGYRPELTGLTIGSRKEAEIIQSAVLPGLTTSS
ncbi:MAG: sodium/solute symporter [Acidobacteria bacterium]|nr:sodium/solute symporter [Acidobacteriota bacterium]